MFFSKLKGEVYSKNKSVFFLFFFVFITFFQLSLGYVCNFTCVDFAYICFSLKNLGLYFIGLVA